MANLELKGQDGGNRVRWLWLHVSQQWVFMLEILIKSTFKFSQLIFAIDVRGEVCKGQFCYIHIEIQCQNGSYFGKKFCLVQNNILFKDRGTPLSQGQEIDQVRILYKTILNPCYNLHEFEFSAKVFLSKQPQTYTYEKKIELIYWQEAPSKGFLILNAFYITTKVIHTFSDHEQRNL